MRFTSTSRYILLLLSGCLLFTGLMIAAPLYLPNYVIQFVVDYVGYVYILAVGIPMMYVSFSGLFATTNEYARGILEVYLDADKENIHLFTYHTQSRVKIGLPPLRLIQHYFIVAKTGKLYYDIVFTHSMESLKGSSGYDGYTSFEESVLDTPELATSMKKIADKSGVKIALGRNLKPDSSDEFLYPISDERELRITRTEQLYTRQHRAVYIDRHASKVLWKDKI